MHSQISTTDPFILRFPSLIVTAAQANTSIRDKAAHAIVRKPKPKSAKLFHPIIATSIRDDDTAICGRESKATKLGGTDGVTLSRQLGYAEEGRFPRSLRLPCELALALAFRVVAAGSIRPRASTC